MSKQFAVTLYVDVMYIVIGTSGPRENMAHYLAPLGIGSKSTIMVFQVELL